MSMAFSGSDLVEVAVQMERNGEAFYSQAAQKLADPKAKDLLTRLARDEVEHRKLFERMLGSLASFQVQESYPGEYQDYLKAHVASQVFTAERMERLLAQKSLSERDALQFGIDSEKDAILYYSEMKRFVPGQDHQTVDGIIGEERKHFSQLVELAKAAR